MSSGNALVIAKKRKVEQSIGKFLANPKSIVVGQRSTGAIQCPWCLRTFDNTQGYTQHKKQHILNNDPIVRKAKHGPVKIRFDLFTDEQRATFERERAGGTSTMRGGVVDLCAEVSTSDGANTGSDNNAVEPNNANDSDANDSKVPPPLEGGHPWADSTDSNDADCGEDSGTGAAATKRGVTRQKNMKPCEVVEMLDEWYKYKEEMGDNKKGFSKIIQKNKNTAGEDHSWNRPKFEAKTLRRWLKREQEYRESAKAMYDDRRNMGIQRESEGKYPEMEERLAAHIRYVRALGLPIESWMLEMEGKVIFHELFPNKCPKPNVLVNGNEVDDSSSYPIQFSNRWKEAFYQRHHFSLRKIGTKMNKKGVTPGMIDDIREYHINTRALQLSQINDPVYGLTSPEGFFHMTRSPSK